MKEKTIAKAFGIKLEPRGRKIVDLQNRTRAEDFAPFGCTFVEYVEEEHRAELGRALEEIDKLTKCMTRALLIGLLEELGRFVCGHDRRKAKKDALATSVAVALIDVWFPIHFVNAKGGAS